MDRYYLGAMDPYTRKHVSNMAGGIVVLAVALAIWGIAELIGWLRS